MNQCSICNRRFDNADLLQSNEDEFFCKECFKYEYCAGRQLSTKKKSKLPDKCEGDSVIKARKMFSLAELSTIKKERNRKVNFFTSKRPLQCPHIDCNKSVSIFDLIAHFQHEHMEVKVAQTTLDTRNPLTFHPRDIRYGLKQCLILLNVLPTVEEPNNETTVSIQEKPSVPVTIAVLASRLATAQLSEDDNECVLQDEDLSGSILGHNDKIIIWTASNVVCDYSYTVAVSTVTEDIRVKYYGPVLQLGNSSQKLCMDGHCLILSHFHFLGMSDNGTRPLHLDVIIHSED